MFHKKLHVISLFSPRRQLRLNHSLYNVEISRPKTSKHLVHMTTLFQVTYVMYCLLSRSFKCALLVQVHHERVVYCYALTRQDWGGECAVKVITKTIYYGLLVLDVEKQQTRKQYKLWLLLFIILQTKQEWQTVVGMYMYMSNNIDQYCFMISCIILSSTLILRAWCLFLISKQFWL